MVDVGLKENAEQLLKKRLETKEPLTPWEQFLQKKKEKKKQKTRKQVWTTRTMTWTRPGPALTGPVCYREQRLTRVMKTMMFLQTWT